MYLSPTYQKRYPRFCALLRDIKPLVDSVPRIKKALLKYTGNNPKSIDDSLLFAPGSLPNIVPSILPPELNRISFDVDGPNELLKVTATILGRFDPNKKLIEITEYWIIRLEQAKQESYIYGLAFLMVYNMLHELAHYLRFYNEVGAFWKDKIYDKTKWGGRDQEKHDIDEQKVQAFTTDAFEFNYPVNSSEWKAFFPSYGIPYNLYYRNLKKRLIEEKKKEEAFNPGDFRSIYGSSDWP